MGQIGSLRDNTWSVHVLRHAVMVRAPIFYDCDNGIIMGILKARACATTAICIDPRLKPIGRLAIIILYLAGNSKPF